MNRPPERDPAEPDKPAIRRMGRAYQGAFEAVIAVAVAGVAGGFADAWLGTSPIFLMAGVILGFGSFALRLFRLMQELGKEQSGGEDPPDASDAR